MTNYQIFWIVIITINSIFVMRRLDLIERFSLHSNRFSLNILSYFTAHKNPSHLIYNVVALAVLFVLLNRTGYGAFSADLFVTANYACGAIFCIKYRHLNMHAIGCSAGVYALAMFYLLHIPGIEIGPLYIQSYVLVIALVFAVLFDDVSAHRDGVLFGAAVSVWLLLFDLKTI